MATWKDGAAYAPVERPDGFATPVADPLPAGEAYRADTPGPIRHPEGFEPMPPQQPLGEIGPRQGSNRDPREAFEVLSSLVTAGPDAPHSGPRDPRMPFPMPVQSALETAPPPPTGPPLEPAPVDGPPPPQAPAHRPRQEAPVTEAQIRLTQVAAVLCLVGFLATSTAPFMLVAAGIIGLVTKRLTKALGNMALGAGAGGVLLSLFMESWRFAPFASLWGLIALICSIGFFIYASQGRAGA